MQTSTEKAPGKKTIPGFICTSKGNLTHQPVARVYLNGHYTPVYRDYVAPYTPDPYYDYVDMETGKEIYSTLPPY